MSFYNGFRFPRRLRWLLGVLLLAGCGDSTTALSYLAVNHTKQSILFITINGEGGILNTPAMGGGGGEVCCVVVPTKWRPGLTATIGWQSAGRYQYDKNGQIMTNDGVPIVIQAPRKTRTVPIPEYDPANLGRFHIHFLPNDQVLVKIGNFNYRKPGYYPPYPDQSKEAPQ